MSTPTTAVATLAHYHPHHYHSPYPHHQGRQAASTANYRSSATVASTANPSSTAATASTATLQPSANRLLPLYQQAAAGYSSPSDAAALPQASPTHPPLYESSSARHQAHTYHDADKYAAATMPTASQADGGSSRKRRRSREPDWKNFYRNGLPKEVIVIDDTPEPEANIGRKLTNANPPVVANDAAARQPARKKRRDDEPATAHHAGYHVQYVGSHTNTPHQNTTPIGSTLSSDRTNSALHTTAPTSLSADSQHDNSQLPLKRKRTRQQVASEAKRRDVDGLGEPFLTYKPLPYPPKKASEVHVRVVHDVSDVVAPR
jgi:dual-specificity kinase